MIKIDGSHEAWFIYSDWLEDQGNELCHQIRSDLEDDVDNWIYEYRYLGVGGDNKIVGSVGGDGNVGSIDVYFGKGVGGRTAGSTVGNKIAGSVVASRKL
jgi:hypothetical protein